MSNNKILFNAGYINLKFSMTKYINSYLFRATQEQLDKLYSEIDTLNKKYKTFQERLDERKKEFNVFVTSMHELLAMLDSSDSTPDNDLSLEGFEDVIDMDRYGDMDDSKMDE